ncbi:DUF4838 domain-containing protein [bacterium]|nr:DUF4838 domain-containing protein [bacterium]
MRIAFDNLSESARRSVREDLQSVRRRGGLRPDQKLDVRLVALARDGVPAETPRHAVPIPAAGIPTTFAARCVWESQRQTFELVQDGGALWVIGGDENGVLYGFDEVLERRTGVIWAGLRDEDLLFGPTRPLPAEPQRPRFPFRGRETAGPTDQTLLEYLRWMGRNRYNLWKRNSGQWNALSAARRRRILGVLRARGINLSLGDHAMDLWLPAEEFARHPEWFGERDGVRVLRAPVAMPECVHSIAVQPIQPCYSNAAAADYITDRIAEHLRETPEAVIFNLWPHDGINNWCQCPACLQRTPYEHLYALALRLIEKLPAEVPVELIAYSNLLNPPRAKLPRSDRTYTLFCPYLRPFRHRFFDAGGPERPVLGTRHPDPDRINPVDEREYGLLFDTWQEVWRACGSAVGVFDYAFPFSDETGRTDRSRYLYHPPLDLRRAEIEFYARRGALVYVLCTPYTAWPDNFHEWTVARFIAGDDTPLEEMAGQFYTGQAGRTGVGLREALQAVADRLLAEETPTHELERLSAVLDRLPPCPAVDRYRLWHEYVARGRKARDLALAGRHEETARAEGDLQQYLLAHAEQLQDYFQLRTITCIAAAAEEMARARITARRAAES